MKHWVFDLDGTLVDSFELYFQTLSVIFKEHGTAFTPELRKAALTEPLEAFFAQHLGNAAVPAAFQLLQHRSNEDAKSIRPFGGFETILQQLLDRGARVAVWTNRDLVSASLILEHSGLARLTEACISGTCVQNRKPHPEGLERLIARFGCAPSEVTMVGDHEYDVSAARKIGVRAVRASWHSYWSEAPCSWADAQFGRVEDFGVWALQTGPQ
jgi:HAD superfamily hydrolase (TIGR01509 family)